MTKRREIVTMGLSDSHYSHTSNDKLDAFSLIWLDGEMNTTQENRENKKQLEESFNHVINFDNSTPCEQHIKCRSQDKRIILIVSGRLGRSLVPNIHSLPSVVSIYIYCGDLESNEQWAAQYPKVTK